jgi:hypothetical protein
MTLAGIETFNVVGCSAGSYLAYHCLGTVLVVDFVGSRCTPTNNNKRCREDQTVEVRSIDG